MANVRLFFVISVKLLGIGPLKFKFINLKSFESIQKKTLFFKQIKNFHKKKREKTLYFFLLICYIVC